jgi:hypothetical protein
MKDKNQLLIDEVNGNLAIYLGFILTSILFALASSFFYIVKGSIVLQVMFFANLAVFFYLLFRLYSKTQALIIALRTNIPLSEAEKIANEATSKEIKAGTSNSTWKNILFVTVFVVKMIPLGFFFTYMIIITIIDYIKGNSKASGFIEDFKNSLKKKAAVVVNKD